MANENRTLQLYAKLTDNVSSSFKGMGAAARQVGRELIAPFRALAGAITSARGILTGFLGVLTVRRGVTFLAGVSEDLDKIAKLSDNLGLSAESLTAVRNQAELAGVSMDELGKSLKFFEVNISKAADGSKAQANALHQLGLRAEDFHGQELDTVEVLARVSDGMRGVGDATERTRILTDLFGRSGANLGALLKQGSTQIRQMAVEARALGGVFTREELHQVEQFNDAVTQVGQTFRTLWERIVIALAPALKQMADFLRENLITSFGDVKTTAIEFARAVVGAFQSISIAIIELAHLVDTARSFITGFFERAKLTAASAKFAFSELFGTAESVTTASRELADAMAVFDSRVGADAESSVDAYKKRLEAAKAFYAGLLATLDAAKGKIGGTDLIGPKPKQEGGDEEPKTGFFKDLGKGIEDAKERLLDFSKATQEVGAQLVAGPMGAFQDNLASIIDRTKSAKEAFRDFGKATIRILAEVLAKLITVKLVTGLFGGFGGLFGGGGGAAAAGGGDSGLGIIGGFMAKGGRLRGSVLGTVPFREFADGGVARGPTLALMGEGRHRAEAFVPLPDGKSIPVTMRGEGGGGTTVVNNWHINAIDTRSFAQALKQNRGMIEALTVDAQNRNADSRQSLRRNVR